MPDSSREFYKYRLDNLSEDVDRLKSIVILGAEDRESLLFRVKSLEDNIADIAEIKSVVNNICEKVTSLEREDKNSRIKIMILLIALALSYLGSLVPKIATVLENIIKYI